MNQTKIPAIKAITVSVIVCILLSMSAYAEAAGTYKEHDHSGKQREKEETVLSELGLQKSASYHMENE